MQNSEPWQLCLYVVGMTPSTQRALQNIRNICEENIRCEYSLEIVDLEQHPSLVKSEQILATPLLVRKSPLPLRKMIGDFSDKEKLLNGLDLPQPEQAK